MKCLLMSLGDEDIAIILIGLSDSRDPDLGIETENWNGELDKSSHNRYNYDDGTNDASQNIEKAKKPNSAGRKHRNG